MPVFLGIVIALLVGAVLGFLFLIPLRFFKKKGNRLSIIVGFVFAGLGLAEWLGLSNLLLCMERRLSTSRGRRRA